MFSYKSCIWRTASRWHFSRRMYWSQTNLTLDVSCQTKAQVGTDLINLVQTVLNASILFLYATICALCSRTRFAKSSLYDDKYINLFGWNGTGTASAISSSFAINHVFWNACIVDAVDDVKLSRRMEYDVMCAVERPEKTLIKFILYALTSNSVAGGDRLKWSKLFWLRWTMEWGSGTCQSFR